MIHRVDGRDRQAAGIGVAPGQVRRACGQRENSQEPAVRLEHPDPQRDGDVDSAGLVDFHPVGTAGLARVEPREHAAGAGAQRPVGFDVERPDVITARVANIERSLVGRKRQAVGLLEIVGQKAKCSRALAAQVEGENALEMKRPLAPARRRRPGR